MGGQDEIRRGNYFLRERLFWKGRPLPFGILRWRYLLTASERGYYYPEKLERDTEGVPIEPPVMAQPPVGDPITELVEAA